MYIDIIITTTAIFTIIIVVTITIFSIIAISALSPFSSLPLSPSSSSFFSSSSYSSSPVSYWAVVGGCYKPELFHFFSSLHNKHFPLG
jgi:hypothetical protein